MFDGFAFEEIAADGGADIVLQDGTEADGGGAVFFAHLIHGALHALGALAVLRAAAEEARLLGSSRIDEVDRCHRKQTNRLTDLPRGLQNLHGSTDKLRHQIRWLQELLLAGNGLELGAFDVDFDAACLAACPAQPGCDCIGQGCDSRQDFVGRIKVFTEGSAVADGLDVFFVRKTADRTFVQTVGICPEHAAGSAQKGFQKCRLRLRQCADRAHAALDTFFCGGGADGKKLPDRQGPKQGAEVFACNLGRRVRLFIFRAHFGENLVEGNAGGEGQTEFLLDRETNGVGNLAAAAEQLLAGGNVEPGFIDAERLHQIGIAAVDLIDFSGVMTVFLHVRRHQHQPGTFAFGLPEGLGGDDAVFFGWLVFGEDNAVAAVRITADGHRYIAQFRALQKLDGCKKTVHIAVQNDAVLRWDCCRCIMFSWEILCCHGVRDASFCGLADQFSISYLCGFCEAFPHFLT